MALSKLKIRQTSSKKALIRGNVKAKSLGSCQQAILMLISLIINGPLDSKDSSLIVLWDKNLCNLISLVAINIVLVNARPKTGTKPYGLLIGR